MEEGDPGPQAHCPHPKEGQVLSPRARVWVSGEGLTGLANRLQGGRRSACLSDPLPGRDRPHCVARSRTLATAQGCVRAQDRPASCVALALQRAGGG